LLPILKEENWVWTILSENTDGTRIKIFRESEKP